MTTPVAFVIIWLLSSYLTPRIAADLVQRRLAGRKAS